jgi:hypothetical protein
VQAGMALALLPTVVVRLRRGDIRLPEYAAAPAEVPAGGDLSAGSAEVITAGAATAEPSPEG